MLGEVTVSGHKDISVLDSQGSTEMVSIPLYNSILYRFDQAESGAQEQPRPQ